MSQQNVPINNNYRSSNRSSYPQRDFNERTQYPRRDQASNRYVGGNGQNDRRENSNNNKNPVSTVPIGGR